VTRSATLTAEAPSRTLEITTDAGQGLAIDFEGEGNDVQAAARVRMQLNEWDHDTVVRYRSHDGTESIVLSAAGRAVEEITLTSEPGDPPTVYVGNLELLAGEHAEVGVTVDTIAAYLNGVPRGAEATATITFHANQR
jgi:hypothetical protein